MNEMTWGTDTELMLVDCNGVPVSAINKIGGTKDFPRPTKHGAVQEDGVLAEFNIPPVTSGEEAIAAIKGVMGDLQGLLSDDLRLTVRASSIYPLEELKHPAARISGCDPDYNIWVKKQNIAPDLGSTPLRSAGGHIHVGGEMDRDRMVKAMDLYLGVPSVLMDHDTMRKKLFGKAGAYRAKLYGVEYRTLSNFWIKSHQLILWAFNASKEAYKNHLSLEVPEYVEQCINTNDYQLAEQLIADYGLEVV